MNEKSKVRLAKLQRRAKKHKSPRLESRLERIVQRLEAAVRGDRADAQKTG